MFLSLVHPPENIMHMTIQANGFVLTAALKTYTEKRVRTALGWAGKHLRELHVSLSDINGPRGGCDKRCRILVQISGGKGVVIEDTETDLYHAIDRAAERVDRAVVRRIEQLRGFSHVRVFGPGADIKADADGDPR
jgi:ribosomal subunit interface protein